MILFRQLFDQQSSTYTYLLADAASREAILIDPVFEQARRDSALLSELDLTLLATLETHVHADQVVSRIWWKFSSDVLRASGFGPDQAARSRLIGAMG